MMNERPKRPAGKVPMSIWWDMGEGPQAARFCSMEWDSLSLFAEFLTCLPEHVYEWLMSDWGGEAVYFSGPPNTGVSSWPCEGGERITHVVLGAELLSMTRDLAFAAIARTIAHLWLGHHRKPDSVEERFEKTGEDDAANAIAESWGFDVKALGRLQQRGGNHHRN
jgi:hypothetical protein